MARSVIHNQDVFFQKMKKKPALQAILDNLGSYTVEQLQALPNQPLWIREALVKLHSRGGISAAEAAERIADAMQAASAPQESAPREVRQWKADDTFLGSGANGSFALEVQRDDLILLLPPRMDVIRGSASTHYEAKIAYTVIKLDATQWSVLLSSSALVGMMTVDEYNREVQRRLVVKYE